MNHKLLQQALDALNGGLYRSDSIVKAIEALEAELAKPDQEIDHPNPAAKHWHDLYREKCKDFHDKQAMLGAEIVALEEELEELKEEIEPLRLLAKMKPRPFMWVGLTDKERNEMIGKIQHDQFTTQRNLINSTQIITEMYLKEKNNA